MRTPGPPGGRYALDRPGLGPEVVGRVLGVDPELDGVAGRDDIVLVESERLAGRDPDLRRDHVDAGQRLGHRMLDLDPAVDLDEVEVALGIDQELERADVLVTGADDGPQRALAEVGAGLRGERRCRRLFDDLLVAPLDGAVALAEMDAVAVSIDRDLDLDVAVVLEPLLEVERVVAEGGPGLAAADLDRRFELARRADHAHALAAATGRWLEQDRVADPLGLVERVLVVAEHAVGTGHGRQAEATEQAAGRLLGTESLEHGRRWADERQAVRPHHLGEILVLGQEAVARVDRVAAGHDGGRDDRRGREVAPARIRGADADGLLGEHDRQALAIGLAVGDDGRQVERPAGAQDSQRDLAAVGDEDLGDHQLACPLGARPIPTSSSTTRS